MAHLLIHRGLAKKNFSENTIAAFRYCFKKNYGIETDIHCTKDNKIVCFHNFNLKGKFKVNKSLKKIKYQELLKISKYKKKPIPLLKDLIKLSKNKKFLQKISDIISKYKTLKGQQIKRKKVEELERIGNEKIESQKKLLAEKDLIIKLKEILSPFDIPPRIPPELFEE